MKENGFDKAAMTAAHKADESMFTTLGSLCRLFNQGMTPPDDVEKELRKKIKVRIAAIVEQYAPKPTEKKSKFDRIQEAMIQRRQNYIASVDEVVDNFIRTWKTDFSAKKWILEKNIPPVYVTAIRDNYTELLSEISKAITGDDFYKEAYSNFTKPRLCLLREFLMKLMKECDEYCTGTKKARKPRKVKEKSPEKIVKKVKYCHGIPELKITSVNPDKIVKASQVWLFNTTYRYLTVLNGKPDGLMIRGTTVYNFDEDTSMKKKVRKPAEVLPKVVGEGKVYLRKVMDSIKCRAQAAKGRLGDDTVILRVV